MANTRTPRGKGKRAPARSAAVRKRAPQARRSRTRSSARARRRGGLSFAGLPQLPVLDQRQRDVLGLALGAVGIFMGFILYCGWNGGRAGHGIAVALGW